MTQAQTILYVAPTTATDGNPSATTDGTGSATSPLTLAAARDRVRQWTQQAVYPEGGVEIRLLPGDYRLTATLELTPRDSGRPDAPVVWRAQQPGTVRIMGSQCLREFEPVSDPSIRARLPEAARDHVVQVDLKTLGIHDYGSWRPRGQGAGSANAAMELFDDTGPLTPARWPKQSRFPNRGFEAVAGMRDDRLIYSDPRPATWAPSTDIYLHGFFSRDWASTIVRVTEWDHQRREIALDPPHAGPYGVKAGGRFFYFNILEELSEPGEWVLDRETGKLYVRLPDPTAALEVSLLETPLISLKNVEDVRFEGLTLAATRGDGVAIQGGRHIMIGGCRLTNIGRSAIRIQRGHAHSVIGCDIDNTGESGVEIHDAGDRRLGESCRHRVENCHLHHIAREGWTYFESVRIHNSCGVTVTHNRFNDHPHAMLHYRGNDHVIECNEFYNFTLLGDDCGCMYYGRDLTLQGNVIRYNYLHHAGDSGRNDWGSAGVYNDDGAGGSEIYGNVFLHVNKGILAGGGINMRIHHNLFCQCRPAIWFDQRLASAQADRGEKMMHEFMRGLFYALDAHQPPFADRYPGMDAVHNAFQRGMGLETLNAQVRGNVIVGSQGHWLHTHWSEYPDYFDYGDNEDVDEDLFADAAFGDFQLPADHALCRRTGYRSLDPREVGIYRDARFRPAIESVRTALEIVRPAGRHGEAGRARLRLRNDGDIDVAGVEYVEIKQQAHGPGFSHVEVPFAVQAGCECSVEFDVDLDPGSLHDCYEVYLHTRGERIRPAWNVMPVACPLDTRLDEVALLNWTDDKAPGRFRLQVMNRSDQPAEARLALTAEPAGIVAITPDQCVHHLTPGERMTVDSEVRLRRDQGPLHAAVVIRCAGDDARPSTVALRVVYPVRRLDTRPTLDTVAVNLQAEPVLSACRKARLSQEGHYGDFQLAAADGHLVINGTIIDPRIAVSPMLWDGSCVEVFACNPERERIGHVFGSIEIGQVYLVPACGDQPARAYRFHHNRAECRQAIHVASAAHDGGYSLQAIIPFAELALPADAREFLFEIQATVSPAAGRTGESRGNLFGSESAFNDSSRYGLAMITDCD